MLIRTRLRRGKKNKINNKKQIRYGDYAVQKEIIKRKKKKIIKANHDVKATVNREKKEAKGQ